jgi:hypothetical protein
MTDDAAYGELMALGYRRVPVAVIGDVVIQGYDTDALELHTRDLAATADTAAVAEASSE